MTHTRNNPQPQDSMMDGCSPDPPVPSKFAMISPHNSVNRLNNGFNMTLHYNGAGSYSSTGTR